MIAHSARGKRLFHRFELAAVLVQNVEHPFRNREEAASEFQFSARFLLLNARESAKVIQADLYASEFHSSLGLTPLGAVLLGDLVARIVQKMDPVGDETAFALLVSVKVSR